MYKPNDSWEIPPDDTVIWRYMDVTKLLGILHTKALYFPNVTMFEDKYEGYTPVPSPAELKQQVLAGNPTDAEVHHIHNTLRDLIKALPRYLYVNCWHMNDEQSAAMWKLYLSAKEGVAIQSTFQRLRDSFNGTPHEIQFGKVRYLKIESMDFAQRNTLHTPLLKRPSFAHEQELRAIFKDQERADKDRQAKGFLEPTPAGYNIPTDLDVLIESIVLAPTCDKYIKPVIESVLDKFGVKKPVIQSNLNDDPIW